MNLAEAIDHAGAISPEAEKQYDAAGELTEFVESLNGVLNSKQSNHAVQLLGELQISLLESKEKAELLTGCLASMKDGMGT